jgi:ATF/CREB family transcription factor
VPNSGFGLILPRIAALKCRQRKKQWLQNLQTKVDVYSSENDQLTQAVHDLRNQVQNLKSLLAAHKDCPVTMSQGISSQQFMQFIQASDQINYVPVNGVGQMGGVVMGHANHGTTVIPRT